MDIIARIFDNPIVLTAFIAWFAAQFLKIVFDLLRTGQFDIKRFIGGAGGMPSSHSSLVISTCVITYFRDGPNSSVFAIAMVLAGVVMYDALGVRRAAGEQAKVINALVDEWDWSHTEIIGKRLKELLGHTPLEVLAGAILGIAIGYGMAIRLGL